MKYALNTDKYSVYRHPDFGDFQPLIARPIEEKDAEAIGHLIGIIVFDGFEEKKKVKELAKEEVESLLKETDGNGGIMIPKKVLDKIEENGSSS